MWQYNNTDELYHYGVMGMKWGVRRATKRLNTAYSSGKPEKGQKAINSLNKHKNKITKKIKTLNEENAKLKKKEFKSITKYGPKIAELDSKISDYQNKANNAWSERKYEKYTEKARVETLKVNKLKAKTGEIKAAINKNEALTKTFNQTLSEVNKTLSDNGRRYLESIAEPGQKIDKIKDSNGNVRYILRDKA